MIKKESLHLQGEQDAGDTDSEASPSGRVEGPWKDLAAFLLSDDDTAVSLASSWLLTLLISLAEQYLQSSEPRRWQTLWPACWLQYEDKAESTTIMRKSYQRHT